VERFVICYARERKFWRWLKTCPFGQWSAVNDIQRRFSDFGRVYKCHDLLTYSLTYLYIACLL